MQEAINDGLRRSGKGSLAVSAFKLSKDLRFTKAPSNRAGATVNRCAIASRPLWMYTYGSEFDGLPVFGGGPCLQNQPRYISLAYGKDFNPIAG